jgi:hypothetical protein
MANRRPGESAIHYKVVELSTVDESSLERALNDWTGQGWAFDGLQFAMRESSKRPAMAFLLFTRRGELKRPAARAHRDRIAAKAKLERLAERTSPRPADPRQRLRELAGLTEPDFDDGSEA